MDSNVILIDLGVAYVGHDIYVGNHQCCNIGGYPNGARVLHIWRSDHPDSSCHATKGKAEPGPDDLVVEYKDGQKIQCSESHTIEQIEEFFRIPGPVFVHCAVGQTRSPTLAIIGKAIRGCDVYQAYAEVLRGIHATRGIVFNVCLDPTTELLSRYGHQHQEAAT